MLTTRSKSLQKYMSILMASLVIATNLFAGVATAADLPPVPPAPTADVAGSFINAAQNAAGFSIKVSVAGLEVGEGNIVQLYMRNEGSSVPAAPARTLTVDDIAAGEVSFFIQNLTGDGKKEFLATIQNEFFIGNESPQLDLTLDTVAPTAVSGKITGGNTATVTFSEAVNTTVESYSTLEFSTSGQKSVTSTTTGAVTASITFDGAPAGVTETATGDVKNFQDLAGNIQTETQSVAFSDGQAPAAPVVEAFVSEPDLTQTTFTGTAEPGSTVVLYHSSILPGDSETTLSLKDGAPKPVADAEGKWTFIMDGTLSDGFLHKIRAKATDGSENTSAFSEFFNAVTKDATAPQITFTNEDNPVNDITREFTDSGFVEPGVEAFDSVDGTVSVTTEGSIDMNQLGVAQTLLYHAVDKAGNESIAKRLVTIVDTTAPTITLKGENPMKVQVNGTFTESGFTAIDLFDRNITENVNVDTTGLNLTEIGQYNVVYSVADSSGNKASKTRVVNVVADATAPVITLKGENPVTVAMNSEFKDAGATALDNVDGDLTESITTKSDVDTSKVGTYTVTYFVSDKSENTATATRTVKVTDQTIPVITLLGSDSGTINVGETYTDAGATALDNLDGDITAKIEVGNGVDTSKAGTYLVTYNVKDAAGNSAKTVTRTIEVKGVSGGVAAILGGGGGGGSSFFISAGNKPAGQVLGAQAQRFPNGTVLKLFGKNEHYLIVSGGKVRISAFLRKKKYAKNAFVIVDKKTLDAIPRFQK